MYRLRLTVLEVQAHCRSDGVFSLRGVAIFGFRTVRVSRVWDDPGAKAILYPLCPPPLVSLAPPENGIYDLAFPNQL